MNFLKVFLLIGKASKMYSFLNVPEGIMDTDLAVCGR